MPRYLLLIAGLVLPLFLAAQTSVSGTVVNGKDDQPIPYANLKVLGTRSGTSADETGQFTLPLNKPRTSVRASALGFRSDTFQLSPGDRAIVLRLEPDNDLPTITVNSSEDHPLEELKREKYLPTYLTSWGNRVVSCYQRSAQKTYELRVYDQFGTESRHELDFGKIEGITSKCSDRLYVLTKEHAISMQYEKGKLVPIERIPRNDYDWLFADCRDRVGEEFLYERKRLLGMHKFYLLLEAGTEQQVVKEFMDSSLVEEMFGRLGIMRWEASTAVKSMGDIGWRENQIYRRALARSDFDLQVLFKNHHNNPFFFHDEDIKLVNFDEGQLETYDLRGGFVSTVPFSEEVDEKYKMDERIFRDPATGITYALARARNGYRLYRFDVETGEAEYLLRVGVESVSELVVLEDAFFLLGRKDRYGMESQFRMYRGRL